MTALDTWQAYEQMVSLYRERIASLERQVELCETAMAAKDEAIKSLTELLSIARERASSAEARLRPRW